MTKVRSRDSSMIDDRRGQSGGGGGMRFPGMGGGGGGGFPFPMKAGGGILGIIVVEDIFLAIFLVSKGMAIASKRGSLRWIRAEEIDFVSDVKEFAELTLASEEYRAAQPPSKAGKVSAMFF